MNFQKFLGLAILVIAMSYVVRELIVITIEHIKFRKAVKKYKQSNAVQDLWTINWK